MAERCKRIADSGVFQGFILGVIVLNAITLGIQTYDLSESLESTLLTTLDDIFLGIFVVELDRSGSPPSASRPQDFFQDGWNVFDFVVIALAFVPGVRENARCCGSCACCGWSASSPSCPTSASCSARWCARSRRS